VLQELRFECLMLQDKDPAVNQEALKGVLRCKDALCRIQNYQVSCGSSTRYLASVLENVAHTLDIFNSGVSESLRRTVLPGERNTQDEEQGIKPDYTASQPYLAQAISEAYCAPTVQDHQSEVRIHL
jgi:hypothetical protein